MASNGASVDRRSRDTTENSLERIKRQLASGSGRHLLQGPLLKRSETGAEYQSAVVNVVALSGYEEDEDFGLNPDDEEDGGDRLERRRRRSDLEADDLAES